VTRSLIRHHPRIGYTYVPDLKTRVSSGRGGYLLRTNGAGFRSDREFVPERRAGAFRVLLFGDSQTAGDGVSNSDRYSDVLERTLPEICVYNFGLTGSGTDQHFLTYQEFAYIDHDLVVLAINVDNIWRVQRSILKFNGSDNDAAYYQKPYYKINENALTLCGVPVPKQVWSERNLPFERRADVLQFVETHFLPGNAKLLLSRAGIFAPMQDLIRSAANGSIGNGAKRLAGFQPVPDYNAPDRPGWLLLRAIIASWVAASRAPMLVMPIPLRVFVDGASDPSAYQARFRELARSTGCLSYDPLSELAGLPPRDRATLWDESGHLSRHGHEVLANRMASSLRLQMGACGMSPALNVRAPGTSSAFPPA
jgi:hypothetical protein